MLDKSVARLRAAHVSGVRRGPVRNRRAPGSNLWARTDKASGGKHSGFQAAFTFAGGRSNEGLGWSDRWENNSELPSKPH